MVLINKRNIFVSSSYFRDKDKCAGYHANGCLNKPRGHCTTCSSKCTKEFDRWYCDNYLWNSVKERIFERDNYTCVLCKTDFTRFIGKGCVWQGVAGRYINCDHKIPYNKAFDLHLVVRNQQEYHYYLWKYIVGNKANLRTLCIDCHDKQTAIYMKEVGLKKRKANLAKKNIKNLDMFNWMPKYQ